MFLICIVLLVFIVKVEILLYRLVLCCESENCDVSGGVNMFVSVMVCSGIFGLVCRFMVEVVVKVVVYF